MRRFLLAAAVALPLLPSPAAAGLDEGLAAFRRSDFGTALTELEPLARQGDAEAQSLLGVMYARGHGVAADQNRAAQLFTTASAKGSLRAIVWLGNFYRDGQGGMMRDEAKAAELFRKAADGGDAAGINNLGNLYLSGRGVPRDIARAADLYRQGAEMGNAASQRMYGLMLYDGVGTGRDRGAAIKLLQPLAEKDDPEVQAKVGMALLDGDGGTRDPAKGAEYLRRAAERGRGEAQFALGKAYLAGNGVSRSAFQAYFWLSLASDHIKPNLKAELDSARATAAAALTPAETTQALDLTRTWKPKGTVVAIQPGEGSAPLPRSGRSAGSGIVVSRDGKVLTNAHVVPACSTLQVTTTEGRNASASVLARDDTNDLALLSTSLQPPDIARFRDGKPIRSGDNVVVVGYPLSTLLSREPNVTAGVVSAMAGIRGDVRHYQITAPVQKGNSGGPLADMSGNIIGVVSAKLDAMKIAGRLGDLPQNVNFAIKSEVARRFLTEKGVKAETASGPDTLSAADVGERIKRVTVYVECAN